MRVVTLQWAGGIYCVLLGTIMLALPEQFGDRAAAAFHLPWLGPSLLLGGAGLLASALFVLPRPLTVVIHAAAGCVLLLLAHGDALAGTWTAAINKTLIGLGLLFAPALPVRSGSRSGDRDRDLLVLLLGAAAAANGVIMLALPGQFSAPLYEPARPHLAWFGMVFVAAGAALVALQAGAFSAVVARTAYLIAAGTFFAFLLLVVLPARAWAPAAFYVVFGVALAILPYGERFLGRLEVVSLRARIVIALVAAMTLAMLVPLIITGDWAEATATAQVMETQRVLAAALARDVRDILNRYRDAAAALAATPGLLQMTPESQLALVRAFQARYHDAAAFLLVDASGHVLVRSDDRKRLPAAGARIFEMARRTNGASFDLRVGPSFQRPVLQFAMAIHGPRGEFAGIAGAVVEPNRIFAALARAGAGATDDIYLVDEQGRAVAHRDPALARTFTDLSGVPPVAALLADRGPSGAVKYVARGSEELAAYARVPGVGWGVIVERPTSTALAVAVAGRELSFLVNISTMVLVALAGTIAAGALVRPLEALAREVGRLGEGAAPDPLPQSTVPEIARLSAAFEEMRRRLAARTAERESAEAALKRHAQELARSNAELEEFAYVASHDLQEPLRIVKSYLQLLEKRYARKLDRDADQFIGYAVEGASRMQQLINDLLAYSRAGTSGAAVSPTDSGAMLNDAVRDLEVAVEESGAVVTRDPLPTVMVDGSQLRQVFQNLLANAIKFRNSARPRVHVSADRDGDGWVFSVRDNGIGIAPQYAERIFVIFQRLHARDEYPGTGIGLAICKKIVERRGGRIWVESQPGEGATFRFTVPDRAPGARA